MTNNRIPRFVVSLRAGIGIVFHSPWGWVTRAEHAALFRSADAASLAVSRLPAVRGSRVVAI